MSDVHKNHFLLFDVNVIISSGYIGANKTFLSRVAPCKIKQQ